MRNSPFALDGPGLTNEALDFSEADIEQQARTYEASSFVETGSSAVNRWVSAIEHSLSR